MTKHRVKYARFDDEDVNAPEMTLSEIARELGLSETRCGDIYRSAMKKVRLRLISLGLDRDVNDAIKYLLSK